MNERSQVTILNSKVSKIKRKKRRKELFIARLKSIIRFTMILFILYGSYKLITLQKWYLVDKAFEKTNSKYLKIYGNELTPDYQIKTAIRRADLKKVPIYMLDTKPLIDEIAKLDPINSVYITRYWFPARLEIYVEEKIPLLTLAPSEKVPPIAFFTTNGKLIGREYLPLPKDIKTYKILSYGIHGDDYRKWDVKKVNAIATLAKSIEFFSKQKLEYIDMRNPKDLYAKIPEVLLRIGEYNNTALKRIESIEAIIPQLKTLDKKIKYVDLRWEEAFYIKLEGE